MHEGLLLSGDGLPIHPAADATFLSQKSVAPGFHDGKACCGASGQDIPARQARFSFLEQALEPAGVWARQGGHTGDSAVLLQREALRPRLCH